jgi:putative oxidoreductase
MKKLMSTNYSAGAFNLAMLVLRIGTGGLLINHGYGKLVGFSDMLTKFHSMIGLGARTELSLVVFAEFFCSIFIMLGLFTRLTIIPIIITMCIALFIAHKGEIYKDGEMAALYLCSSLVILILGPGKISVDGLAGK